MSLPAAFLTDVAQLIPSNRRFDDPLSTLAFGTDASFYRLIPQLVIRVESEDEVVALLQLAQRDHVPVTFRAAGTSLSGQAISDSVLIVLGDNWNGREIRGQGTQIRLQPGVIGAQATPGWRRSGARSGRSGVDQRVQNRRHRCQQCQRHVLRYGAKHLPHPGRHPPGIGGRQPPGH